MSSYKFTPSQDWFTHNEERWTSLFPLVKSQQARVLEIGSWEGRSAVFLLNNLCGDAGEITCIDHFDLFTTPAGRERFATIQHNLGLTGKTFRVVPKFSFPALMTILAEETKSTDPGFDWIYVDGSHEADDTMLDGELAWRLARKHAIIIFDDYHWDKEPEDSIHHPKLGIDTFMQLHRGEFERLSNDSEYQVVLRKLVEMRIGFLVEDPEPSKAPHDAFGYGINVVITVDAAYAVGAAVTVQSIVDTTRGRVSIYVVDIGLTHDDKIRLEAIVKEGTEGDFTIIFIQLLADSLSSQFGTAWVKLDMLEILPVERVLYLDADILVRRSLKDLWHTDLAGKPIGAAIDVGHPMGHEEAKRRPYFNAGVLLLDIAQIRHGLQDLLEIGKANQKARFRDQDALNIHFSNDWTRFGVEWNAQGLGTYAEYPSEDRKALGEELERIKNPNVVHFTGPVHPTLAEVLNPFVQPPTAKPWGYVGARGHPFESDWWATLEKTAWKGLKSSEAYLKSRRHQMEVAISEAKVELEKKIQLS